MSGVRISQLIHASVLVQDLAQALRFYVGILGLVIDESRPDLGYPGAWLHVGAQQLHLLQLPNPDPTSNRPAHGGRDRHIALAINSIAVLQQALDAAQITYTKSKSGRRALFCRDPDGNALEFIETT
jgi:glyoxylase I family protein